MGVECQAPTFYPLISALLSNNPCAFCAAKCDRVYTLLDVIIQSRSLEWVIPAKSAVRLVTLLQISFLMNSVLLFELRLDLLGKDRQQQHCLK